jgi:hypothetical protein
MGDSLQVVVDIPGQMHGAEIIVAHLGIFPNGETSELTEHQVARWVLNSGYAWPESGVLYVGANQTKFTSTAGLQSGAKVVGIEPVAPPVEDEKKAGVEPEAPEASTSPAEAEPAPPPPARRPAARFVPAPKGGKA